MINAKLQIGKRGQKTADWEKAIKGLHWTVVLSEMISI